MAEFENPVIPRPKNPSNDLHRRSLTASLPLEELVVGKLHFLLGEGDFSGENSLLNFAPGSLTWNQKVTQLKRKIIPQTSIFGFKMLIFQGVHSTKGNELAALWIISHR